MFSFKAFLLLLLYLYNYLQVHIYSVGSHMHVPKTKQIYIYRKPLNNSKTLKKNKLQF